MITPRLTIPSDLFYGFPSEHVRAETVNELRETPLGGHYTARTFVMTRSNGETRRVSTINEVRVAEDEGFSAASNTDMRAWSYFKRVDDLLSTLLIARASNVSFLKPVAQADLLPAQLVPLELNLNNPDTHTSWPDPQITIADMVREGRCKIEERDSGQLIIRAAVETTLTEVMKGDFNDDGIEDVLVWQFHKIASGTMHWSSTLALTRTNEHSLFSRIRLPFQRSLDASSVEYLV